MNTEEKKECLSKLAEKRKNITYNGYKNLSDIDNGFYECDYVSPWSKSAHNEDADIMIVLQDWADEKYLDDLNHQKRDSILKHGYDKTKQTNINLKNYFKKYFTNQFGITLDKTYITNQFPLIKKSNISKIGNDDFDRFAKKYTIPMIKIVQPTLIIAVGKKTFDAFRRICIQNYDDEPAYKLIEHEKNHFTYSYYSKNAGKLFHSEIWFQYHTSKKAHGKCKPKKTEYERKNWSYIIEKNWEYMANWFFKNFK